MSDSNEDTEGQMYKMKQSDAGEDDTEGQGLKKFHVENEGVEDTEGQGFRLKQSDAGQEDTEGQNFKMKQSDAGEEDQDDTDGNAHRI